ncbi:MAG TPA: hypothetical protein VHR17_11330 [Thermoanaerobaculia bacterium]|jgi:hypothetical protein|nr:hypothetical protein [Thermoanaerobaculia bacterium]
MQRLAVIITVGCLLLVACEAKTADDAKRSADRDRGLAHPSSAGAGDAAPRDAPAAGPVSPHCTFRNVDFIVEPGLVLEVRRLVGELRATGREPATFDDPRTFSIAIAEAEVALDMPSLAAMMNDYVFAGPDAPMRGLEIQTEGKRLRIKGTLHKGVPVPFTMLGDIKATEQGEIEIVPAELHAAGVPVRGLLDFFGVELDDLVKAKDAVGIRVEENALYLQPRAILPPPRLDGKIVAVEVVGDQLVQRFGGRGSVAPVEPRAAKDGNSMAFRGGMLRFGRLTMEPTDLTLVDADSRDPFLFSLRDYGKHLTAGYSRTLADGSLVTVMPDYDQADRSVLQ